MTLRPLALAAALVLAAAGPLPAAAPAGPVAFVVTIRVKPGMEQQFLDLLTPVLDAMRHEETFVNAILHRDPEDPTRFLIYETWTDLDDVARVQMTRAYRRDYWEGLPALLAVPREVGIWHPVRADFAGDGTE